MQTARKPEHATTTNPVRQLASDLSQLVLRARELGHHIESGLFPEEALSKRNALLGLPEQFRKPAPPKVGLIEGASILAGGIAAYLATVLGDDDALRLEYDLKARLHDLATLTRGPIEDVSGNVTDSVRLAWQLDWCECLEEIDKIQERLRMIPVTRTTSDGVEPAGAAHGDDFRSVNWWGEVFRFTPTQAACVKVLWEAMVNGAPEVSYAAILEKADSENKRLDSVFRDHPAWGTMIITGRKGARQLSRNVT